MVIKRRACLAWFSVAGLPLLAAAPARSAPARPTAPALMLAREAPAGLDPQGYLVSEKYDGVRACWDGRQLRFRSGLPVPAPAWFTARLPATPLDGELWLARGEFEALSGTVRKAQPVDAEWRALRYIVFDLPGATDRFAERALRIQALARVTGWPQLVAAPQERVPDPAALQRLLEAVVQGGGEGLVLHRADALWQAGRSDALLKLKPLQDAEAEVLAHLPGQGKHAGRLGAVRVRSDDGVVFQIGTGFSDAQRIAPPPVGSRITFSYRGTTAAGVPRFASFVRVRDL